MSKTVAPAIVDISTRSPSSKIRHRCLAIALLGICVSAATTAQQPVIVPGPHYEYRAEVKNNADLCGHMLKVFNTRFQSLWDTEMPIPGDDPIYSQEGKYAFPRAEGVAHDKKVTFDMHYSKLPSSPEFDAVQWIETRAANDLPSSNGALEPVLMTHVDIDNDGKLDTVVKSGFTRGYGYMANSTGEGHHAESFFVWRSQLLPIEVLKPLWILQPVNRVSPRTSRIGSSSYQRLFVYRGKTYVADYDMDIGVDGEAFKKSPYKPAKETMVVARVHATIVPGEPLIPSWDADTECLFNMIQIPTKKQ